MGWPISSFLSCKVLVFVLWNVGFYHIKYKFLSYKMQGKLEIEATNKDGRKRKYESFSTGKLYASQEKHKSKKKKTQSEWSWFRKCKLALFFCDLASYITFGICSSVMVLLFWFNCKVQLNLEWDDLAVIDYYVQSY